ncbi:MAG: hypothetical protein MUE40_16185, partial [Anaerolineae bacterium]|nr:hypothetical protein [Anaerolineae bacterium]
MLWFKRLLLLCVLLLPPVALAQPAPTIFPLAVVYEEALYVLAAPPTTPAAIPTEGVLLSDTPTYHYQAVWSPDGRWLAYTVSADGDSASPQKTLRVWDGRQSIDLVTGTFGAFPIYWTRDGRIVYMLETGVYQGEALLTQVYTIAPEAGAQPDLAVDNMPFAPCFGGSSFPMPMDWLTWEDSDFGGSRPLLALTDYGVVYSECKGTDIALYRPFTDTSDDVSDPLGDLSYGALSPDQTRVAGKRRVRGGRDQIVNIDLLTMTETHYRLPEAQDAPEYLSALAWGGDGSLYYATWQTTGNLLTGLDAAQQAIINTEFGFENTLIPQNTVRVYHLSPEMESTPLLELPGYSIPRMQVRGSTLLFSVVSNGENWVAA